MNAEVFLAVLAASALKAGWNALVKAGRDRFFFIAWVSIARIPMALPLAFAFGWPEPQALPWLIASVILHSGYQVFLAKAYEVGDLAQVYPLARGTALLLVSIVGAMLLDEMLSLSAWIGVLILLAGVVVSALRGAGAGFAPAVVGYALLTACFIAAYTLSDGLGARANGSAHVYAIWLFLLNGVAMSLAVLIMRGRAGIVHPPGSWRLVLLGATMAFAAYWIAIWAMTQSPIGLVTALRESSIPFASLIGVVALNERVTLWRSLSAGTILVGIAFLYFR